MSTTYRRPKSSFTSLDTAVIARELNKALVGGRIDNIYRSSSTMLLKVKGGALGSGYVLIDPARRAHLTWKIGEKDARGWVPTFRAFMRGAVIENVEQVRFERILVIGMRNKGSELSLYIELIPRGIVALANTEGKALAVTSSIRAKDRTVVPGGRYTMPPPLPDVLREDENVLADIVLRKGKNLGSALVRELGVPPEVVNEVIQPEVRTSKPKELGEDTIIEVIKKVRTFMLTVIESPKPVVVKVSGRPLAFHPFIPENLYREAGVEYVEYDSFSKAVDDYFSHMLSEGVVSESEVARHEALLHEALRRLDEIEETIKRLNMEARAFSENYYVIEQLWRCVRDTVKEVGWEKVREFCRVNNIDPSRGVFKVVIGGTELSLNIIDPLYRQYALLMKRLEKERERLERGKKAVEELKRRLAAVRAKAGVRRLRRIIEWYDSYHWLITSHGFLAIGGRDAQQNEKVVRKYLGPRDIFVHADVHGASAFVILTEGREVPDSDIREVAVMAASYSKAWSSGFAAVDVFWVRGEQVSKSPPSGQYLPKGSFMIYGKKNYIKGVRLRLAIGVELVSTDGYRLVAGPEEVIKERAEAYIVIEPGNLKRGKVAEKIVERLKEVIPGLIDLKAEHVVNRIPGSSRIVRYGGRAVGKDKSPE